MSFLSRRAPPPRTEAQGFGHAELSAGGSRVVIIPELGGKIASLELGGRQWLWTNPSIPYGAPKRGASYVETAESGGYDECLPSIAPCTLPKTAESFAGTIVPDHGDLWSQRPTIELATAPDAHEATMTWRGATMPFRFRRIVRVESTGEVVMRYALKNEGSVRMPFIWAAHVLLPLTSSTRLALPIGEPVRLYRAAKIELGGTGSEHRWPIFRTAKEAIDLSRPAAVKRKFACKLFFETVPGVAAVEEAGDRLEVHFNPTDVPDFGVAINARGWSPKRKVPAYETIGLGPCIGAPDSLDEALGTWRRAHWLDAGKTRKWTLRWRAGRAAERG